MPGGNRFLDVLKDAGERYKAPSGPKPKYTLNRTKEQKRRQCIDFVWGNLPERIPLSREDVEKIVDGDR